MHHRVTPHDGVVGPIQTPHGQAIDDHMVRNKRKARQRSVHRQRRRTQDIQAINVTNRGGTKGNCCRTDPDRLCKLGSPRGRDSLGVADSLDEDALGKHDRSRNHGTRQGSPPNLVDTCDV